MASCRSALSTLAAAIAAGDPARSSAVSSGFCSLARRSIRRVDSFRRYSLISSAVGSRWSFAIASSRASSRVMSVGAARTGGRMCRRDAGGWGCLRLRGAKFELR